MDRNFPGLYLGRIAQRGLLGLRAAMEPGKVSAHELHVVLGAGRVYGTWLTGPVPPGSGRRAALAPSLTPDL